MLHINGHGFKFEQGQCRTTHRLCICGFFLSRALLHCWHDLVVKITRMLSHRTQLGRIERTTVYIADHNNQLLWEISNKTYRRSGTIFHKPWYCSVPMMISMTQCHLQAILMFVSGGLGFLFIFMSWYCDFVLLYCTIVFLLWQSAKEICFFGNERA